VKTTQSRRQPFPQLPLDLSVLLAFATTPSAQEITHKGNMTDTAAKAQPPSIPGTNMDTATAELTALQAPLSTETSDRFRVVCLSGPIKIMLPISAREESENLDREPRDLHFDASTSSKVSVNTINNKISKPIQLSQPTDIKVPLEEMSENTHMDSASNAQTTKCLSSPTEKSATTVKKPDHNHPEEKLSPLYVLFILTGKQI
jgi:hypothetical protein